MRVLVVQNFEKTPLGQIGTALAEAGATIEVLGPYLGEALPGETLHDAMVVLGGAQSALDDETHPYLPDLVRLMRRHVEADRSVLGVCLGSQLLARGFGATNLIGAAPEFGWCPVERTAEGRDDPVLSAAGDQFRIFQWHDDTFTLPDGALRLATGAVATNQAFRIGRAGYGTQFHFEADRRLVNDWTRDFADYLATRQPGWAERHRGEDALHGPAADATGLALARAWVRTIRPAHR